VAPVEGADGAADQIADAVTRGDRAAIARLISLVERGAAEGAGAVARLHGRTGRAWTLGVTGAPGGGKSTLTGALVAALRARGETVGVLAVDPSSPFSGGAILGDRVRMQDHSTDEGVFIRSMASRGHLGGLALAAPEAVRVLDAAGMEWVVVETVGVGQAEVDIARHADTTLVVVNPGWGDAIQAAKAGLLEIADVFVVNKADRPGADDAAGDLEAMLDLGAGASGWRPPVVRTVALDGTGVGDLLAAVDRHRAWLDESGERDQRRRRRLGDEVRAIVAERLAGRAGALCTGEEFEALLDEVAAGRIDPWTAAGRILAN
jgi:LAO/AO transport system kinase